MRTRNRSLTFFVLLMFTRFSAFTLAIDRTPDVVGKVVNSSNATVEGSALLSSGTILSGEAVYVGEGGSVVLRYSPTGRAFLAPSTQVRFNGAKGNIEAQLLSGTVAVERENKDAFVVKTSTYKVEPTGEGSAKFLVALLPDKTTIVEAQHGKVAITATRSGESYTLAEGFRAEIMAGFPGGGTMPAGTVIGQAVTSMGAAANGKPLPNGEWIFDGDLVSTGTGGRATIQLWPTNLVNLDENTSASFTRPVDRVWLRLQNGVIVVENTGENNVLIVTARFHIEPGSADPSKIRVEVRSDNSTYIQSGVGNVKIEDNQSGQPYLLPSGHDVLVPANAPGVTGLQPFGTTPAPTPTPTTSPSASKPPSAPGSHSNNTTLIIVGIAAAAGIGGAAAVLAGGKGGGGGTQPVSPSVP